MHVHWQGLTQVQLSNLVRAQGRAFWRKKARTLLPGVRPASRAVTYSAFADTAKSQQLGWWWVSALGAADSGPPPGFNATVQFNEALLGRNTLATTRVAGLAHVASTCAPNARAPHVAAASKKRVKVQATPLHFRIITHFKQRADHMVIRGSLDLLETKWRSGKHPE